MTATLGIGDIHKRFRSAIPGVRHSGGPPLRRSAINDDLALTFTTEPVYKNIFFYLGSAPSLDKTASSPFANSLIDSCSVSVGVGTPLIA